MHWLGRSLSLVLFPLTFKEGRGSYLQQTDGIGHWGSEQQTQHHSEYSTAVTGAFYTPQV